MDSKRSCKKSALSRHLSAKIKMVDMGSTEAREYSFVETLRREERKERTHEEKGRKWKTVPKRKKPD